MDRKKSPSPVVPGSGRVASAPSHAQQARHFAEFRLQADGSLFREQTLIHLPPRELAALELLLAHAGQVVTIAQIKKALWGDVHVTADSVPRCLSSLRARLEPSDCIQTVYKRGYRLLAEVKRSAPAASNALPRVAIRPFTTEMGVPEYLGPAIAEEAAARLSNLGKPLASMLARDSVFALARRGMTAQQIGEALQADLVLTGTLRSIPSYLRLRVEMIRIADGIQIWVEDLLVGRDQLAEVESDLAARVAVRLGYEIPKGWQKAAPAASTAQEAPAPAGKPQPHASKKQTLALAAAAEPDKEDRNRQTREAHEAFLRGRHEWQTFERHRMQDGLRLLSRASDLDPSLVGPPIDLSHLAVTQMLLGYMSSTVAGEIVRECAQKAADPSGSGATILPDLALIRFLVDRDLAAALRDMEASAHLAHDTWITRARIMLSLSRHRFQEAMATLRAALELDPYAALLHAYLAWALHLDGQAEASVAQINDTLHQFPEHEGPRIYGAMILAFNGEHARAVRLAKGLAEQHPDLDLATSAHAYALACAGRANEARKLLEQLQWFSKQRYVLRAFNTATFAAMGDEKAALTELRLGNEERGPWFFQMLADPRLKALHGNAEFQQLAAILPAMEEAAAETEK